MDLNNFEKLIDPVIVSRGQRYFQDGCVTSLEQTDELNYQLQVTGTDKYIVNVELDAQHNIINSSCDCPYVKGEFCKHQVAAFLALRASKAGDVEEPLAVSTTVRPRQSKPAPLQKRSLESILTSQTKENLVDFLLDLANESEELDQRLRFEFNQADEQQELQQSVRLIRSYIDRCSGRHGFVEYGYTAEATQGAKLVLDKARSAIEKNNMLHALDLILNVLHEMMKLLNNCDDSDGDVGDVIMVCLDIAGELAARDNTDQAVREGLFNKLLAESGHKRYEGWTDWKLRLLEFCADFADQPAFRKKLEKKLSDLTGDKTDLSWSSQYNKEKISLIHYKLIQKFDGPQAADAFLMDNLTYPAFRRMAIESAMQQNDYDAVIRLALEGERQDGGMRGVLNAWRKARYAAYQLSGQLDHQRELAMSFIKDGSFEFYLNLKKTYSPADWKVVYPQIIRDLSKSRWPSAGIYTQILIEEHEFAKLLDYVKKFPAVILNYDRYLTNDFKEDVIALYEVYIDQLAEQSSNRKQYQDLCAIIRRYGKIGGQNRVRAIAENLMQKYTRRSAMRAELSKHLGEDQGIIR